MPPENEATREMHPAFEEILLDIADNQKRAGKAKALETKHELSENVWPMLKAIAEATNTRFEELEDAVEEFLAEEGNVIYGDLAGPLFGLITLARKMAMDLLDGGMTDVKLQRLKQDAQAVLDTANILEPMVAQAVVQDIEEDEAAPGDAAEGEDDGDEPEGDAASEEKTE
jgi:hypothetical protein